MPIILLGLIFAIGLIIYHLLSDKEVDFDIDIEGVAEDDNNPFEEDENVIFLPNDIESVKEMYKNKK